MTPFLYLWGAFPVYLPLLREVAAQARRYGAAPQPPCGLYLYPSATVPLAGNPDVVLAGLVESNLDHREVAGLEDVLVFGHDSLDLYAWRSTTDEYQILDLLPRDVMETVPSFDALLSAALRRCLTS